MEFINCDCMEYMKDYPDNHFDLAIVDPPYGAGFTEGGGCKGWFSKYHQNPEIDSGGGYGETLEQVRTLKEQEERGQRNTQKKLLRGMLRRIKSILNSFSASHGIRSYGAVITLNYHLPDVF